MSVEIDTGLMTVTTSSSRLHRKYMTHCWRWRQCRRCTLGGKGKPKIFYRGDIPCDVLFVGEAPGFDEQESGFPFVGRAGGLLQQAIDQVREIRVIQEGKFSVNDEFSYGITNAVLCTPVALIRGVAPGVKGSGYPELRKPRAEEVQACKVRFAEFLEIAKPLAILLMGATAGSSTVYGVTSQWKEDHDCFVMTTPHPAWILRRGGVGTADYQRLVLHIRQAVENSKKTE